MLFYAVVLSMAYTLFSILLFSILIIIIDLSQILGYTIKNGISIKNFKIKNHLLKSKLKNRGMFILSNIVYGVGGIMYIYIEPIYYNQSVSLQQQYGIFNMIFFVLLLMLNPFNTYLIYLGSKKVYSIKLVISLILIQLIMWIGSGILHLMQTYSKDGDLLSFIAVFSPLIIGIVLETKTFWYLRKKLY